MSAFRFPSHRLNELVKQAKCRREGTEIRWSKHGKQGSSLTLPLDLVDGPFVDFVVHVTAGDVAQPEIYRASLVLAGERVRGIDFSPIERRKFYRVHIPKGWHENVIDPNLAISDRDRNRPWRFPTSAPPI